MSQVYNIYCDESCHLEKLKPSPQLTLVRLGIHNEDRLLISREVPLPGDRDVTTVLLG